MSPHTLGVLLTVHSLDGRRAGGRQRLAAPLAHALLPVEGHPVASWERLSAAKERQRSHASPTLAMS